MNQWGNGGQITQGHINFVGFFFFLVVQHDMQDLSPPNKRNLCHLQWGVQSFNHWSDREVPSFFLLQMSEGGATV